jgi:hypothetical protein
VKTTPKIAIIGPQDIAKWVTNRKRGKKVKKPSTSAEASEHLIEQFRSEKILAALKDAKGKPVDIDWLVKRWVEEAEEAESSKDRREALEKLEQFIVLGAIQDKDLAESIGKIVKEGKEPITDPFVPKVVGTVPPKRKRRA